MLKCCLKQQVIINREKLNWKMILRGTDPSRQIVHRCKICGGINRQRFNNFLTYCAV